MFPLQEQVFLILLEFLSTIQPKKQVPAVDNNSGKSRLSLLVCPDVRGAVPSAAASMLDLTYIL